MYSEKTAVIRYVYPTIGSARRVTADSGWPQVKREGRLAAQAGATIHPFAEIGEGYAQEHSNSHRRLRLSLYGDAFAAEQ